ncbi:MAG TPA: coagulation factor 5/8 type domain-containing protein, partial [Rhodanobacteraceae bacterium]|nr:coagulation factor 5/8 type domain-containing protein [Rhodanobacteraceae bacterium]
SQDLLRNTFEQYWQRFVARRDSNAWKDYTPYEWRTVSTFVRLGWRDRAQQAIDFFMHDRRPAEWNQWAEVVGRDARESRFVGDMPHGWVASDFIRSVLDVFAYERESNQSLVIAAGVPDRWLDGEGVAIEHLRTPFGALSYSLVRRDGRIRLEISGDDFRVPPGGLVFVPPGVAKNANASIGGKRARLHDGGLRIRALPAVVAVD